MEDQDAKLIALIDDELNEDERSRLLKRLEHDAALRRRYEALQKTGAPIAVALDGLLKSAPLNRLRAMIPKAQTSLPRESSSASRKQPSGPGRGRGRS